MAFVIHRGDYSVSTDQALLDVDAIHAALTRMYWCEGIPREVVERSLRNCIAFGIYHAAGDPGRPVQVGLGRVITDRATFAYLADVYVLESHRGRGLSTFLMDAIGAHPDLQGLRRFCLLTRDAHGLYAKYGFKPMPDASRYLEKIVPNMYKRKT
jgi:GNAT superfamily N-acetyltransferase